MTPEAIVTELRACLALQNEIADKHLELVARYKAILDSEHAEGNDQTIVVRIDGEIYNLVRLDIATDQQRQTLEIGEKLKGFYGGYRLLKTGKIYEWKPKMNDDNQPEKNQEQKQQPETIRNY
jgi:hypothetical protein